MNYFVHFCALMSAPASAIQGQLKRNLKCTLKSNLKCNLKSKTSNAPFYVSLCRLLSASLAVALMYPQVHSQFQWTINFLCSFKCSLEWNLRSAFKCRIEWYLNFTFTEWYSTLLCFDNCIKKCNSSATWSVHFSAISGAPFCASLSRS